MTEFERWYDANRNAFAGPCEHNKYDLKAAWHAATERAAQVAEESGSDNCHFIAAAIRKGEGSV